jgi:hypothetical protein
MNCTISRNWCVRVCIAQDMFSKPWKKLRPINEIDICSTLNHWRNWRPNGPTHGSAEPHGPVRWPVGLDHNLHTIIYFVHWVLTQLYSFHRVLTQFYVVSSILTQQYISTCNTRNEKYPNNTSLLVVVTQSTGVTLQAPIIWNHECK